MILDDLIAIDEWSVMLHEDVVRIGIFPVTLRNFIFGIISGSKKVIEKIENGREVPVDGLWFIAMMPAMKLGIAHEVTDPMRILDVPMTVATPEVVKGKVQKHHYWIWLKVTYQQQKWCRKYGLVDDVKATRGEGIKTL